MSAVGAIVPAPAQQPAAAAGVVPQAAVPARAGLNRVLLAVGAIAIGAIVSAGAFFVVRSNSDPGGITFIPATISCSAPVDMKVTIRLPASVHVGDYLNWEWRGDLPESGSPFEPDISDFVSQADGSWVSTYTETVATIQSDCRNGLGTFTPGTHTERVLETGKVLAQGSYTATP